MQYLSEPAPSDETLVSVPDTWTITQVEYWKTNNLAGGWEVDYLEVKYTWAPLPSGASRKLVRKTSGDMMTSGMSAAEATSWLESPVMTYRRGSGVKGIADAIK